MKTMDAPHLRLASAAVQVRAVLRDLAGRLDGAERVLVLRAAGILTQGLKAREYAPRRGSGDAVPWRMRGQGNKPS
jgi:hypothetical protein